MLDENADTLHCDCRADDWVEGDNGAIRCEQCGGYAGELGTSIRVVGVASVSHSSEPGAGVPNGKRGGGASSPGAGSVARRVRRVRPGSLEGQRTKHHGPPT